MANDITRTPWIIDTPSATTVKAGLTFAKGFEYSGYAAQADQCIIQDDRGINVEVLNGRPDLGPVATRFASGVWIRNLAVTTLTAGKLTVYT